MLILNLIPSYYQKRVKMQSLTSVVRVMFLWGFFEILLITTALLIAQLTLQNIFITTVHNTSLVTKNPVSLRSGIASVNKTIAAMHAEQQKFFVVTPTLAALFGEVDQTIRLQNIALDFNAHTLALSGTAMSRNDLIAFKNRLEDLPFIEHFELPIQVLLKRTDVTFTFMVPLQQDAILF